MERREICIDFARDRGVIVFSKATSGLTPSNPVAFVILFLFAVFILLIGLPMGSSKTPVWRLLLGFCWCWCCLGCGTIPAGLEATGNGTIPAGLEATGNETLLVSFVIGFTAIAAGPIRLVLKGLVKFNTSFTTLRNSTEPAGFAVLGSFRASAFWLSLDAPKAITYFTHVRSRPFFCDVGALSKEEAAEIPLSITVSL